LLQIQTPILTSNDCEGAGEVFTVLPANDEIIKAMRKDDHQVTKEDFMIVPEMLTFYKYYLF